MNIGMLWFDNNPQTDVKQKVKAAVRYYRKKYGVTGDLVCLVHPSMIDEDFSFGKISVGSDKAVLPHHFWVGVKNVSVTS